MRLHDQLVTTAEHRVQPVACALMARGKVTALPVNRPHSISHWLAPLMTLLATPPDVDDAYGRRAAWCSFPVLRRMPCSCHSREQRSQRLRRRNHGSDDTRKAVKTMAVDASSASGVSKVPSLGR